MLFDDRLATVLRFRAQSELATRTQYRQLLDLLGSIPPDVPFVLAEPAYVRLADLASEIPSAVQSEILRSPGLRLRNRDLVAWLARTEPQSAAAAMATAQLHEEEWVDLIPRLPLTARGFLRHRRDLPTAVRAVLDRLGVRDLALPEPERSPDKAGATEQAEDPGIGALVRRIEAFQQARRKGPTSPRLPLGDNREFERERSRRGRAFDFATDALGIVSWADPAMASMVIGLDISRRAPGSLAQLDSIGARAMLRRLPVRGAKLQLHGAAEVEGEWRMDAAPVFHPETGQFSGYSGRLRRPLPAGEPTSVPASSGSGDRMRQLLHELRTPVNAIQGFAEMIQQQMFGHAPNEYRALAAAIAVDSARLMAGFDEIDRLARLETRALELGSGQSDLREITGQLLRRLESVLKPRSARMEVVEQGSDFRFDLDPVDATQLIWRLLATIAGALAPGELIDLTLTHEAARLTMSLELPGSLLGDTDIFAATAVAQPRAITAGMFGSGFTLRLARAEANACGGTLERQEDKLVLTLPALTSSAGSPDRNEEGVEVV